MTIGELSRKRGDNSIADDRRQTDTSQSDDITRTIEGLHRNEPQEKGAVWG